jgi:iron complex transport system permease protein
MVLMRWCGDCGMFENLRRPNTGSRKARSDVKSLTVNLFLVLVLVVVFIAALFIGSYGIDPFTVVLILLSGIVDRVVWALGVPDSLFLPWEHAFSPVTDNIQWSLNIVASLLHPMQHTWPDVTEMIVWKYRFPRAIAAMLVGAGLAVSGASFQSTFRNPIVSESILGVSAGASVGAAIAILLSLSGFEIEVFAFASGLLAVGLAYGISRVYKSNPIILLVLAGVIVGSLFGAITNILTYIADPETKLPAIVFWMMGSFAKVTIDDIYLTAPFILAGMLVLFLIRWRLNPLSMGDEEARALGINTSRLRGVVILCATIITAAATCMSGGIGWVGLIIPHIGRRVLGPDHKGLIPATMLAGAAYMVAVDTVCRNITQGEIAPGIVTALIGTPIFLYILYKTKENWS